MCTGFSARCDERRASCGRDFDGGVAVMGMLSRSRGFWSVWGEMRVALATRAVIFAAACWLPACTNHAPVATQPPQASSDVATPDPVPNKQAPVDQQLQATEYQPPATRPGPEGEEYVDAPELNESTTEGLYPGHASPEAALVHFYASLIRGDERWKEVAHPEGLGELQETLEEIASWKFLKVRLVGKQQADTDGDTLWIRVEMTIEVDGETDAGVDEATVQKIDGSWYVVEIPC